jgi:hypothetical protein
MDTIQKISKKVPNILVWITQKKHESLLFSFVSLLFCNTFALFGFFFLKQRKWGCKDLFHSSRLRRTAKRNDVKRLKEKKNPLYGISMKLKFKFTIQISACRL